ncbi:Fructose-2,6-bisphosphatase [Tulasnella sp. 408]|nr:Fructose-2,6-bisphosphatase [Tulasnella sp. 408]
MSHQEVPPDARNTNRARRARIAARISQEPGFKLVFLETICEDLAIIEANITLKTSVDDPDYSGLSREEAVEDYIQGIRQCEAVYETMEPFEWEGMPEENEGISPEALEETRLRLLNAAAQNPGQNNPRSALVTTEMAKNVWTSALRRTIHTARHLRYRKMAWKALDEIDAGVCDGMTYKEIEEAFPGDFAQRDRDKFNYRYSGGESYRDVVARLEPVILQLEREKNILVIGHQAILRCLYAYFHGSFEQDDLPYIPIPLHTIIKLTPTAYGCEEERYTAPIEASSTHRPKPSLEEESS